MQYAVTRQKATERPFTGEYEKTTTPGTYRCVACGQELFASDAKFESHCGWPSFTAPLAEQAVASESDKQPRHGAHRSPVLELRFASRPRLQRRPEADRPALLHQFGSAQAGAQAEIAHCPSSRPLT